MLIRIFLAAVLAVAATLWIDWRTHSARLSPPGFQIPARRILALTVLSFCLFLGVFSPLTTFGLEIPESASEWSFASVFLIHGIFLFTLGSWFALGYLGFPGDKPPGESSGGWRRIKRELGLRSSGLGREVFVGLWAGLLAWGGVLAGATVLAAGLTAAGWPIEQQPPELVTTLAALPVALRLMVSLSAGVVEELFFRGFLQMRLGVLASTAFFVAGHLGYGQLFLLFGVTLLSLIYAALVRWRRSLVAAMVAHSLFDAIQLLVVIPAALQWVDGEGVNPVVISVSRIGIW